MKTKYDLRIEPVTEAHIPPYVEMSTAEFGPDAAMSNPDHLRWKFLANPAGESLGAHLYCDGRMVGRHVSWPRRFVHAGKTYRGGIAIDLLIDRDHRQPATMVQILRSGMVDHYELWFSVAPNAIGWQLSKRFGVLTELFDLDVAVLPLKPTDILRTRRPAIPRAAATVLDGLWRGSLAALASVNWCASPCRVSAEWPEPAALAALAATRRDSVVGERNQEFLDWRFRQGPLFKADVAFLHRKGALVGYLATRRTEYLGFDCVFIVDAFGAPDLTSRDWGAAIRSLISREARSGAQMIGLIGNGAGTELSPLLRLPFIKVPRRLLPRRLTVFGKSKVEVPLGKDRFHMTLADYDVA